MAELPVRVTMLGLFYLIYIFVIRAYDLMKRCDYLWKQ